MRLAHNNIQEWFRPSIICLTKKSTLCQADNTRSEPLLNIVVCQSHPALVKIGLLLALLFHFNSFSVRIAQFPTNSYTLSLRCVPDPTMACNNIHGAIIFYREGGRLFVRGPEFWGVIRGGTDFFSVCQRGVWPEFFEGLRGGAKIFYQFFLRLWRNFSA